MARPFKVALLIETSSSYGRGLLRGISRYAGKHGPWSFFLEPGGQDEHPCEVNNSTTARGSAWAGRMTATIAQTPSAPDHREIQL